MVNSPVLEKRNKGIFLRAVSYGTAQQQLGARGAIFVEVWNSLMELLNDPGCSEIFASQLWLRSDSSEGPLLA